MILGINLVMMLLNACLGGASSLLPLMKICSNIGLTCGWSYVTHFQVTMGLFAR